jgi:3-oxoadipate enol-lactonase
METIEVGGCGLAYEIVGGGPRTVALLNGIAMSVSHWKPVTERLAAAGWRVLCHDMRGQLLSDKPGDYTLEGHARDLAALMDRLGIPKLHVLGTSYGAEVGLAFARDFPDRTESLILVDGVSEADALLTATVESWLRAARADPGLFYRTIIPWNYSAGYIEANREALDKREAVIRSLPPEYFEAFAGLCEAFLKIDLTKDLGRIRCPTLVVVADKDILKHRGFSEILVRGIPGSRLVVIPGAGHAVVVEKPDAVADAALGFWGA